MIFTTTPSLPPKNFTLEGLQAFNDAVYGSVNGPNFERLELMARVGGYASRVLLWVRKKEMERTGYHLAMMFSWLCAVATRMDRHLYLQVEAHCAPGTSQETTLRELQEVFARRHSSVSLEFACLCLAEKILAVNVELAYFQETHSTEFLNNMMSRLAQSVEAIFVFASKSNVDLGSELERHFEHGCNKCMRMPCGVCGHRTDKIK